MTAGAPIGVMDVGVNFLVQEAVVKRSKPRFRLVRRGSIGVGTFLFGWGWVGVVPISLPVSLPAITLPSLTWLNTTAAAWRASAPIGGQTSGVPEPASWALMIGGMLLIGAALRARPRWLNAAC